MESPFVPSTTSPGEPLPDGIGAELSAYFGADLSGVRVHSDTEARDFLGQAGAEAAAYGDHIYLSKPLSGVMTPKLAGLVGHEVAHVVQHRQGRTQEVEFAGAPGALGHSLERQARFHQTRITSRYGSMSPVDRLLISWVGVDPGDPRLGAVVERVRSRLDEVLPTLLPGQTVYVPHLAVEASVDLSIDPGRAAEDVVDQISQAAVREAQAQSSMEGGAPAGVLLHEEDDAGGGRPSRLRIVAEPTTNPAVVGMEIKYQIAHDPIYTAQGSRYPRISKRWQARTPSGRLIRGDGAGFFSGRFPVELELELTESGRYVISTEVEWSRGEAYPLTYTQEVKQLQEIVGDHFDRTITRDESGQLIPASYINFRGQLAMQRLRLSHNTIQDQRFGRSAWITSGGPNPVVARWNLFQSYTVHAPREAVTFAWYFQPKSWRHMPTQSYHGARRTTLNGQQAYYLGSGETVRLALTNQNVFTIVCRCLDANGKLVDVAHYVQAAVSQDRFDQLAAWRQYVAHVDEAVSTLQEGREIGVPAMYVNAETGVAMQVALFLGPDGRDPSKIRLLDLTPGVSRIDYEGGTVHEAINSFENGNSYPEGLILLEIPPNQAGFPPLRKTIRTTGASLWSTWSSRAGWASMGLAGLGLVSLVVFAPAAPFLFTAAGGVGAVAGGLSLFDNLQQTEVNAAGVTIDVLGIAGSILGGAAAFQALRRGAAITLANRSGKFIIWGGFASDAGAATLVTVESLETVQHVLGDNRLSTGQKMDALVRILANLALTGGLLVLSGRDLSQARAASQAKVQGAAAAATRTAPAVEVPPQLAEQVRPDLVPAVKRMFDEGPNRWVELPHEVTGQHLWQRGMTGDYRGPPTAGVDEALRLLKGEVDEVPRFASEIDDVAESIPTMKETNSVYATPMGVRGRAETLTDVGGIANMSVDMVEAIGTFTPHSPEGPSTLGAYRWARNYLDLRDQLVQRGLQLDPNSRGGRFAAELQDIFDNRIVWKEDSVVGARYVGNESDLSEWIAEVFGRYGYGPKPEVALTRPQYLTNSEFEWLKTNLSSATEHLGATDIRVHGSRASGAATPLSDIDIAIRVPEEQFIEFVHQRFRGVNPGSRRHDTMLHALEVGKVRRGDIGMSGVGKNIARYLGIPEKDGGAVQISLIMIDGPFDQGPWVQLR